MDLSRFDHEIDVVVGDEAAESFGDSAELELHIRTLPGSVSGVGVEKTTG